MRKRVPIADRAWAKIEARGPDDCWPWIGAHNRKGQGHLSRGGRGEGFTFGYRVIYEQCYGPLLPGQEVCHSCDNQSCCNPRHLFSASHKMNMLDMASKERSPRQKLSREDVLAIRQIYPSGLTKTEIGARFGVSRVQVANIVTVKHWVWC